MPFLNGKPVDEIKPTTYTEPEAPPVDAARAWRVARFDELGFGDWQAELLADTKDHHGVALYWADIAALLQRSPGQHDAIVACYA